MAVCVLGVLMSELGGGLAARLSGAVVLVVLAVICFSLARQAKANSKTVVALGLIACAMALYNVVELVRHDLPPAMLVAGYAIEVVLLIAAATSAFLGLYECLAERGRYTRGKVHAIASIVLSALLLPIPLTNLIRLPQDRDAEAPDGLLSIAAAQADALRFDELNFRFQRPKQPWAQVDAKKINTASTLAFVTSEPEMAFMVVAEAPGVEQQGDLATVKDLILANHRAVWDEVHLRDARAETLGGIAGERLVIDVAGAAGKLTYVTWLGLHQGYIYQLHVFSNRAAADDLDQAADEMFARFSLIDEKRIVHSAKPLQDYHSPLHGYTLRLAGTPWQPWENLAEVLPDAECGAIIGNYARSAVIPVSLFGHEPRLEAVTFALLSRLGIAFSASQVRNIKPLSGFDGHRFEMTRDVSGRTYNYRCQVVKHAGRGYLVAAWADNAAPQATSDKLDLAIERFELDRSPAPPIASPSDLALDQKQTHAQVFNDLGLYHFNARLFAESVVYFRHAFEMLENDPVLLDNVVNAYFELNQFREARDYLDKHLPRFPNHRELRSRYAFAQGKSNDAAGAIKAYGELFAGGWRNDQALQDYVQLLAELNRVDEALAQIGHYVAQGASPVARRLEAMLYSRKGDHARAISLLKDVLKDGPFNVEVAYDLAEAHLAAQQYQEGLAVCRELIDRRFDTAHTYLLKGRLELALRWYAAAKSSLEASLRQDPANQVAQSLLDQVSGMMGEGSNSSVKDPIEPVPIPSEIVSLESAEAAETYRQAYGACYLQRITAIAFDPGKEAKTTTRQVIKLFDSSGVTRYSTFQLEFDPLGEQLYVNSLRVIDADGKEIAFGKPSDYYVIDESQGEVATQRKLLNVPVPGLQPGHTIELVFTRRELVAPEHFPFTEHYFTAETPILRDSVYVRADAAAVLPRSSAGLSPQAVEGGQAWTIEKPPVFRHEPMQAPLASFVPYLLLGSPAESWPQLAAEYLKSIEDRLEIESSTRTLAEQTIAAATSDEAKAAALVRLVREQLTYKAIEFGRRARMPNKASTVLANRYGDCKDHSLLLVQLLQAAGIEARLALVRTDGYVDEALASLDQFDHMIVFTPKLGEGRFFDCTDKDLAFDQVVPRGLAERAALVLDRDNPRFVALGAYAADSNRVESARTLRLVDEADLAIEETVRLEGYLAATLRGLLKEVQPANRTAELQKQLSAAAGGSLQVQKVEIENLEDKAAPLVVRIDCLVKGKFHAVGDSLVGQIPALWERFFLNAQRVENRQTPFIARYPLRVKSAITLGLPAGFTTGDMGSLNKEEQTQFAQWRVTAAGEAEGVRVEFEASRGVGQYAPDQYAAYCDAIERTVAALAQNVVLKRVQK